MGIKLTSMAVYYMLAKKRKEKSQDGFLDCFYTLSVLALVLTFPKASQYANMAKSLGKCPMPVDIHMLLPKK